MWFRIVCPNASSGMFGGNVAPALYAVQVLQKSAANSSNTLEDIVIRLRLGLEEGLFGTDKLFPKKFIPGFYDRLVSVMPLTRILEIGVRGGASLRMWSEFLEDVRGGKAVGIDNFSDSTTPKAVWVTRKNVQVIEGDAYDPHLVAGLERNFDLIVDDGPHDLQSQKAFLELYWPLLAPGGVLVVEDILGGRPDLARLINSLHLDSRGCVGSIDLRRVSGCSDALLLVVHKCDAGSADCFVSGLARTENGILPWVFRVATLGNSGLRNLVKKVLVIVGIRLF